MMRAIHAVGGGAAAIIRAPHLIVVALVVTLAVAAPFGAYIATRLQTALAGQPVHPTNSSEIDPEWWLEYRSHATGLDATFTPAIVGFAAPLSNFSALLDGTPQPPALIVPAAVALATWAMLWGGLLSRFARRRRLGIREFVGASRRYALPFIKIAAIAVAGQAMLYLTIHRLLFGPVFNSMTSGDVSELAALSVRVALYVVFGACLVTIGLVADYARALAVVTGRRDVNGLLRDAWRFVYSQRLAVTIVFLIGGVLFIAILALYGYAETLGGSRLGGWRAIAVGQGYIIGRLAIKLLAAASQVRLLQLVADQN